jgi:Protein involved in sex pheromone biosynthesis
MKKHLVFLGLAALLVLSACGNKESNQENNSSMNHSNMDNMSHNDSGDIPAGLKEAANPKFKGGSQAVINADHMPGMNGATATIVGAYNTTVYAVSYTPTDGGPEVTNHKWVIHEELKNPGNAPLSPGAKVTLEADHMAGMKGAEAKIDSAEQTTVYMVDYTPTTGGKPVKNHKWVVESELNAK